MMNFLHISYPVWKTIAQANTFPFYHKVDGSDSIVAFTGDRAMVYRTYAIGADYTDWAAAFLADSAVVTELADGQASVYGLSSVAAPVAKDGRRIQIASAIGDDQDVQYTGAGDNIVTGARLVGQDFRSAIEEISLITVDWQFMEWIEITGGRVRNVGSTDGDFYHYDIYAPATTGVSNPGAGAFDKYNLGGPNNMFVPNPTNEGDWDVDIAEKHNANVVFTKAVPVIAKAKDGYFDWDPVTYALTVNATGTGKYYLFDFEVALIRVINKHWMVPGTLDEFLAPAAYAAKKLLPQYIHQMTINKSAEAVSTYLYWELLLGRADTTL